MFSTVSSFPSIPKKKRVKCTLVQALRLSTDRTAHRASRGIALLLRDHSTRRGEELASRSGRSLPPGKTRYPLYMGLGGPQGRSGQAQKISPTLGFDPRTVQPVASRYIDYATRPTTPKKCLVILRLPFFSHSIYLFLNSTVKSGPI
jgi:hypothetical protein